MCPATFNIVLDLLQTLTPRAAAGEKRALSVATSVLRMLTANIRRLVVSGIRPADVGLDLGTTPDEGGESKGAEGAGEAESKTDSALAPLQKLLENLAGLPGRASPCTHPRACVLAFAGHSNPWVDSSPLCFAVARRQAPSTA